MNKKTIFLGLSAIALCLIFVLWLDRPLYLFLRGFDCGLFRFMDVIFAAKVLIGFSAGLAAGFWMRTKIKKNPGTYLLASVVGASLITGILKVLIGRMRPVFFDALGQTGFYPFNFEWAFNSMPSGHTAASFAALTAIALMFPKYKWAAMSLGVIIGISRVCVGAHWPSDVVLAAFIGISVTLLIFRWMCYNKSYGK